MSGQPVVISKTLTVSPADEKTLLRVEFEPGNHAERIEIRYYASPGNVVDLGLEQDGQVNGWSGGARKSITVSAGFASPGYRRTRITDTRWNVLLGLYKIRSACDICVEITVYPKHRRWLKGDTHMHSVHSDGKLTVNELIARAQALQYDFLCFTDHNTTSQNAEIAGINSPVCLIPGMELTSDRGHVNFIGRAQPVANFLPHFSEAHILQKMDEARRNGARVGINHPFCHACPWMNAFVDYHWLEIWNGPWRGETGNEEAFDYWYQQLCHGKKIVAVAGSDFHKEKGQTHAHMRVHALSAEREDILDALAQGRSYLQSDTTHLQCFKMVDAGPGETTLADRLHVRLTTHHDNSVLLYTDKKIQLLPNHHGVVNQTVNCQDASFALLRINQGQTAQLITNPIYRG
nr:CehA/McbA family metallohydrolase [uncultured Enterobacter sp.]